jgi:hypothetical protein
VCNVCKDESMCVCVRVGGGALEGGSRCRSAGGNWGSKREGPGSPPSPHPSWSTTSNGGPPVEGKFLVLKQEMFPRVGRML